MVAGHVEEVNLQLQGSVGQMPQKLDFRVLLFGHQVDHQDLQGPDRLGFSPLAVHDEDVLLAQNINGG